MNEDPKTLSRWSQKQDICQLERTQVETPCQIGCNRSQMDQLKNHIRMNQAGGDAAQDVEPEVILLAQRPNAKPTSEHSSFPLF